MSLLLLTYPELSVEDYNKIQSFRKLNDELYYNVVNPHFTLVFPTTVFTAEELISETRLKTRSTKRIYFTLNKAVVVKDDFSDYYLVFLVADEGRNDITVLHDILYSDKLFAELRTEIPYLPHITIGNSLHKKVCEVMAESWNKNVERIEGTISILTIAQYNNQTVKTIEEVKLN